MLKTRLIHPEILCALAMAGHRAKVLITDGNYPHSTKSNPTATKVFLNLAPGCVKVTEVLDALTHAIPIESAEVMQSEDGTEPPIWSEFRTLLPEIPLTERPLPEFYQAAITSDVALVIATGEQQPYANLLLTIGVLWPTDAVHNLQAIIK
ncbi:RbsD/FucU family protein [Armatimonas sp.]|uniref:RbsD/FucU family protein n=1 Tax=Armatimonas sp. TaxID=1872638 RepID=UPI003753CF63